MSSLDCPSAAFSGAFRGADWDQATSYNCVSCECTYPRKVPPFRLPTVRNKCCVDCAGGASVRRAAQESHGEGGRGRSWCPQRVGWEDTCLFWDAMDTLPNLQTVHQRGCQLSSKCTLLGSCFARSIKNHKNIHTCLPNNSTSRNLL